MTLIDEKGNLTEKGKAIGRRYRLIFDDELQVLRDKIKMKYCACIEGEPTAIYATSIENTKVYYKLFFVPYPGTESLIVDNLTKNYSIALARHSPTIKHPCPHYHALLELSNQSIDDLNSFMWLNCLEYDTCKVLYPCNYLAYIMAINRSPIWSIYEESYLSQIKSIIPVRLQVMKDEEVIEKKKLYKEYMKERRDLIRILHT